MGIWECLLLAVGLSMDAFAVSFSKGLTMQRFRLRYALLTGAWFGLFQAGMPLIGYFLGIRFASYVESFDHWIAFALLGLIGGNMIKESREEEEQAEEIDASFSWKRMLPLAVATSIDALAVGVTFAFLQVDILPSVTLIGCTTFLLSAIGVRIGTIFGARFASKAEFAGGVILILLGAKILIQDLGWIG